MANRKKSSADKARSEAEKAERIRVMKKELRRLEMETMVLDKILELQRKQSSSMESKRK